MKIKRQAPRPRRSIGSVLPGCALGLLVTLALGAPATQAEHLPIRIFNTVDGLPHNQINKIVRDSRGLLWFCTADGLSRFDGYTFTNYGTDQGLPHREVNDFLETRAGEYWLATNAGLVRFNPKAQPQNQVIYSSETDSRPQAMFTVILPEGDDRYARVVTVLLEDHKGAIWCGTYNGLYLLERSTTNFTLREIQIGLLGGEGRNVSDLFEDRGGSLWVATPGGLSRRWTDGSSALYRIRDGLPNDYLHDLFEDHNGQLWVGTRYGGFFQFVADDTHRPPVIVRKYSIAEGMPTAWVFQLFETSDNRFWVATAKGILQFFPNRDEQGSWFHSYTEKNGLSYHDITALNEDLAGNLWMGTNSKGAMKLERNGFITYDRNDGLYGVNSIFGERAGGVCFRGSVMGDDRTSVFEGAKLDPMGHTPEYYYTRLGRFDGQALTWFRPNLVKDLGWIAEGVTLQTRNGEWWVGTGDGLYRFPPSDRFDQIKSARPLAVYTSKDGIGVNPPFKLFEDSHGDVWVATMSGSPLMVWNRATETFRDLSNSPGFASFDKLPHSFGEDRAGNVWIGFSGELVRYHDGSMTLLGASEGVPPGTITSIYLDHAGGLWLASARSGLIRVDDPQAPRPTFVSYTTAQGLSSNSTDAAPDTLIVEDLRGHIYIGTGRALDRLDPETGHFRHFTSADGLAPGSIKASFRDRTGVLWFATTGGLSRLTPGFDEPSIPPPILVSGLQVAGSTRFVSPFGESEIVLPDLARDQNQLQIDFVGLSFGAGELLRYQYKLEGADPDWSAPTEQRTVNYARLAPGPYRFLVRAVNSDGVISSSPAVVMFRILPPVWARWWFIALVSAGIAFILYLLYRYRVARLVELERMRTRIASDLHDDIGANLSLIAGLSDVLRQQDRSNDPQFGERLSLIASVSRRSVDAMSDIVWAVNPNRDHLSDLTQRMRRFAAETLGSRGIEFRFDSPPLEHDTRINADVRREVFLIFKEATNNIARHSQCTFADISLHNEGGLALLRISDNGKGFDVERADWGQGLASIRKRSEKIAAELILISSPGHGATLIVKAPLK